MNELLQQSTVTQRAHTLGRVANLWLTPGHPLRREAVEALQVSTGYSASMIECSLEAAFSELTEDKIRTFCAGEPAFSVNQRIGQVLHILPGNVFTAWVPGAVITLLLGLECVLKPSLREPVFAPLWRKSIEEADPDLARFVEIVTWDPSLPVRCGAVVAYGSDESLTALRSLTPPGVRFIGYGHKFSVGVIWREALELDRQPELLAQLRSAIEPFELQGCLSPQILYVEGYDGASVLDGLRNDLRVLPQTKRFSSWAALKAELKTHKPYLSAVGYAGFPERELLMQPDLLDLGVSRLCTIGQMQRPGLDWRNGGINLAEALTIPPVRYRRMA